MKCRCGHGRHWHRQSLSAARKRRRQGAKPTGNLPCQFPVPGRWGGHGTTACGCRNFVLAA